MSEQLELEWWEGDSLDTIASEYADAVRRLWKRPNEEPTPAERQSIAYWAFRAGYEAAKREMGAK